VPARIAWSPDTPGWPGRAVALLLAAAVLVTTDLAAPPAVEATNWSHRIAAVRGSQLYYEATMRAADLQLRSLKHAARRSHRTLDRVRRRLSHAREQRAETRASERTAAAQLRAARVRLARLIELPVTPDDLASLATVPASAIGDGIGEERSDAALGRDATSAGSAPGTGPASGVLGAGTISLAPETLAWASGMGMAQVARPTTEAAMGSSVADGLQDATSSVARLEAEAAKRDHAAGRAARKVHRMTRTMNARVRSIRGIRGAMRAATARRAGAEAGLANAILAMSDLAPRRVAKKTDVRLGQGSDFAWPTTGRLVQGYGCTGFYLNPARGSCGHFHDGIDIAGYLGTPIRAAAVGVISYIGWNPWDHRQRAFMVVVAHPTGLETLYGHVMPRRDVRVGQLVRRGELIGYMGSTGKATGVHLHLEMRRGRTTLDPLAFL
jgi:murein DD-endopeptidase MepM/ murein hydrolase activator NlpD